MNPSGRETGGEGVLRAGIMARLRFGGHARMRGCTIGQPTAENPPCGLPRTRPSLPEPSTPLAAGRMTPDPASLPARDPLVANDADGAPIVCLAPRRPHDQLFAASALNFGVRYSALLSRLARRM
jgi:hypothetical protein